MINVTTAALLILTGTAQAINARKGCSTCFDEDHCLDYAHVPNCSLTDLVPDDGSGTGGGIGTGVGTATSNNGITGSS